MENTNIYKIDFKKKYKVNLLLHVRRSVLITSRVHRYEESLISLDPHNVTMFKYTLRLPRMETTKRKKKVLHKVIKAVPKRVTEKLRSAQTLTSNGQ